ncbi:hypothetical protein AB4140_19760 [Shewanella sp. 10N.286.51.B2]|uniref:hypothetical protein n=1 Tax=Shewanella sp. 10N.286.51.B2 TaxID=3229707 RepID=UPI00354CCEDD
MNKACCSSDLALLRMTGILKIMSAITLIGLTPLALSLLVASGSNSWGLGDIYQRFSSNGITVGLMRNYLRTETHP